MAPPIVAYQPLVTNTTIGGAVLTVAALFVLFLYVHSEKVETVYVLRQNCGRTRNDIDAIINTGRIRRQCLLTPRLD